MKEILRNLARRKLRSTLTISGIVIGIFALTTMGAMAEHFNSLLGTGVQYAGTAIHVGPPAAQQGGLLPLARVAELQRVLPGSPIIDIPLTHNTDVADTWEREGENKEYFSLFSPRGYAIGVNVVVYALTH